MELAIKSTCLRHQERDSNLLVSSTWCRLRPGPASRFTEGRNASVVAEAGRSLVKQFSERFCSGQKLVLPSGAEMGTMASWAGQLLRHQGQSECSSFGRLDTAASHRSQEAVLCDGGLCPVLHAAQNGVSRRHGRRQVARAWGARPAAHAPRVPLSGPEPPGSECEDAGGGLPSPDGGHCLRTGSFHHEPAEPLLLGSSTCFPLPPVRRPGTGHLTARRGRGLR